MIQFCTLHPGGQITDQRDIKRSDILACPHVIMVPDHYRLDGSCRCDDANHSIMADWGYTWDKNRWIAIDDIGD